MFVPIWESRHCLFEAWADEEMFEIIDHLQLAQASATPGNLDELQKAAGFTFDPDGLLNNLHVRMLFPPSRGLFDSVHAFWSKGIVGDEASLFLAELDDHYKAGRLTFNSDSFVRLVSSDWQTPFRPSPKHTTGSSRRVKATLVRNNYCQASDKRIAATRSVCYI